VLLSSDSNDESGFDCPLLLQVVAMAVAAELPVHDAAVVWRDTQAKTNQANPAAYKDLMSAGTESIQSTVIAM